MTTKVRFGSKPAIIQLQSTAINTFIPSFPISPDIVLAIAYAVLPIVRRRVEHRRLLSEPRPHQ